MTIALTVVMTLMFFVISLISGPGWVVQQVSEGRDIISFSLLNGLQFGLWITVIITGVRMLLSEIIPAFHGIADKVIPNAVPGLDVPLLFPNYPTSVIFGFLVSLAAGFIGMGILGAVNYPVVVFPALIPTFFTGAVTAMFREFHRRNPGCVCRFVFERTHPDHRSGTSASDDRNLCSDHEDIK